MYIFTAVEVKTRTMELNGSKTERTKGKDEGKKGERARRRGEVN